ncbi:hypothetical protein PIB30_058682 [Stylosanthes scabra]|uniref:Uncharacterized protein n=1 Tax=Stylosanthes scabra TaxID=79078 RepID=A0ABU6TJT4_9FABA|nr:hypothetical protein [Stylosanthes scabra]
MRSNKGMRTRKGCSDPVPVCSIPNPLSLRELLDVIAPQQLAAAAHLRSRRSTVAVPVGVGTESNLHVAPAGAGNPHANTVDEASSRSHPAPAAASTVPSILAPAPLPLWSITVRS